jgi:EKC/KEOPS complex subunit CGI121/TPRKB
MQTFNYPYLPDELSSVNLWLFKEVQNAAELRTRLQQASFMEGSQGEMERETLNFAFLDASKVRPYKRAVTKTSLTRQQICSLRHALTATHQALLSAAQGSLRTPTVHSEILWNLSPSTNIADAYRAFGLNPSTQSVLLIRVGPLDAGVQSGLKSLILGQLAPLSSLGSPETIDWAALRKVSPDVVLFR